jgi:hypothetical protein
MIAQIVYALCALTSLACMALLLRAYKRTRMGLLLWSAAAFLAFAFSNVLLFVDMVVMPNVDLSLWRGVPTLVGVVLLLYGLIRSNSDL